MLRVKTELWCDVCGRYPEDVEWHHPSATYFTRLAVNASGSLVLPEGWVAGEWDSIEVYCSTVCKARIGESEELRAAGKVAAETDRPDLACNGCGTKEWRWSNYRVQRFVLPPGWVYQPGVRTEGLLFCASCVANPEKQDLARQRAK